MADSLTKNQIQYNNLEVTLNDVLPGNINVLDKVIFQMIIDSKNKNDEPLRLLEKPIFPSDVPIERLNIDDSIVLKLAYKRKH